MNEKVIKNVKSAQPSSSGPYLGFRSKFLCSNLFSFRVEIPDRQIRFTTSDENTKENLRSDGQGVRHRWASLFSEASQDRINVLKGLVDLSSFFSAWNLTHDRVIMTAASKATTVDPDPITCFFLF